ncbi:hypothetical protein KZ813_11420 [Sphingomonas sp. RHCKR7]|uniref:hypothetical protein n=1 Tax=Sphingomonas folli TaxID=2862497 RepID=UPI001CA57E1F|nr:hypothetical protein [Sphingomonas folli]MBW6527451.1 hypothetical protein [Sphingomonas folli]
MRATIEMKLALTVALPARVLALGRLVDHARDIAPTDELNTDRRGNQEASAPASRIDLPRDGTLARGRPFRRDATAPGERSRPHDERVREIGPVDRDGEAARRALGERVRVARQFTATLAPRGVGITLGSSDDVLALVPRP